MEIIVRGVPEVLNWKRLDMVSFQTAACYQWGECRRLRRHSFTVSLSTLDTHTHTHTAAHESTRRQHSSTVDMPTCLIPGMSEAYRTLKLSIWAASPVSGLISSSSFTMPSPCIEVQCLMGEPPPILLYCSWIFGVRRLAMNGPSLLRSGGENEEWD